MSKAPTTDGPEPRPLADENSLTMTAAAVPVALADAIHVEGGSVRFSRYNSGKFRVRIWNDTGDYHAVRPNDRVTVEAVDVTNGVVDLKVRVEGRR